jgi:hypothetical protein
VGNEFMMTVQGDETRRRQARLRREFTASQAGT